jgi:hypothetical protein
MKMYPVFNYAPRHEVVGVEMLIHALLTSALVEVSGQLHAPAALLPGKEPLVFFG